MGNHKPRDIRKELADAEAAESKRWLQEQMTGDHDEVSPESITGKAITRCRDCAAWKEDSNRTEMGWCQLNPPTVVSGDLCVSPYTDGLDGCTQAPDWTVKDMEGTAALSVELARLEKRLLEVEQVTAPEFRVVEGLYQSLNKQIAKLEQEAGSLKSWHHHIGRLDRRINMLEQQLNDASPDAAGVMRMDAFDGRLKALEGGLAAQSGENSQIALKIDEMERVIASGRYEQLKNIVKEVKEYSYHLMGTMDELEGKVSDLDAEFGRLDTIEESLKSAGIIDTTEKPE